MAIPLKKSIEAGLPGFIPVIPDLIGDPEILDSCFRRDDKKSRH